MHVLALTVNNEMYTWGVKAIFNGGENYENLHVPTKVRIDDNRYDQKIIQVS